MFQPIKVIDIELSSRLKDVEELYSYVALKALVRLHGKPVGYVTIPLRGNRCSATDLIRAILDQHSETIICHLLRNRLAKPLKPGGLSIEDLIESSPPVYKGSQPLVTVAVCTRDRTDDLKLCLDAVTKLSYPNLDLLVVDNAPKNDATERLVCSHYPEVRYVCEPRPGLNWARNRAIIEAQGKIIAFTDDDVVVDSGWIGDIARVCVENPEVMAVTGLVVPYELETEAQILFEMYGGFGRGFIRKWYRLDFENNKRKSIHLGAGIFGTGANMAYRLGLFDLIGDFDPALDVGTVTQGGGDLEMFFRVLQEGHTLVYEPNAIVRHRHRRDYTQLKSQIFHNGIGLYSYFLRSALAYPSERLSLLRFGQWWLRHRHIRRLLISFVRPYRFPRDLILAELWGSFVALFRYPKARRSAVKIAQSFGHHKKGITRSKHIPPSVKRPGATAVRTLDLGQPLRSIIDVQDYSSIRIFVILDNYRLGSVDIPNFGHSVNVTRLREAIVDGLTLKLLESGFQLDEDSVLAKASADLTQYYLPSQDLLAALPADISASVVVATLDRPEGLRECLRCLVAQRSSRYVEIIVVDNNPASGLTPPIVAEFPGVVLVNEQRKGLAYARNAGFVASTGDIVIATDDDVIMPPTWLEKLIAPFARSDVMAVTGNVLPLEMETTAQHLFEEYGGLGRGFDQFEADGDWFDNQGYRAVPTWELGATANAAFRATIFSNPEIGLMDEALGPGMPSGVGEDTYLFYKILKADYTIVYEPSAYVWHKHRRELQALRRQIYNYSKGHVAYHLTTVLRDKDLRGLFHIMIVLPKWHIGHIKNCMFGQSIYPLSLIILEVTGNLSGPFMLWKSRLRVKREGRSQTYAPFSQRLIHKKDSLLVESLEHSKDSGPILNKIKG